ncbi:MAG: threonine/serine dehydratase [Saprospiraceae bacterium]|nr:threonine/serine dehydratase [Saprospiraceae bacterium]
MKKEIDRAAHRLEGYIRETPLEWCPFSSPLINGDVFLKMENQQVSGSFKGRGAYNKLLSIPKEERRDAFFVAASTGNHAAAFCHALRTLDLKGKVFLPENVAAAKLDFIKGMGVQHELFGKTSLQTELHARRVAEEHGYILVHPYNDEEIVAGQGTIGAELMRQMPNLDAVIVPVGGGGLIAGIAGYVKEVNPLVQVIGCQPLQSPEMVRSIESGSIITEDISLPTLSDGTAGGLEPGSITFPLCQNLVDQWLLIGEEEISDKIRWMLARHQTLIEGSAGLSLAGLDRLTDQLRGKSVACIICGKRISMQKLKVVMSEIH